MYSRTRKIIGLALVLLCLTATPFTIGCAKKPATVVAPPTDPGVDILIKIKAGGQTLAGLINDGLALVPTLLEAQEIDTDATVTALLVLNQAKVAVGTFNDELRKFATFDANNKGDIAKLFKSAVSFASKINAAGITHIKNPQLKARVQLLLTGADLAINVVAGYLGIDMTQLQGLLVLEWWIDALKEAAEPAVGGAR
jgi:hypothetical protein